MITPLLSFAGTVAAVVCCELVKQAGVAATKRHAPPAIALGLIALDRLIPQLLTEDVPLDQLETTVRQRLGYLTDSDWTEIRQRFDPVTFLARARVDRIR